MVGVLGLEKIGSLGCIAQEKGTTWVYLQTGGNVFVTMHILAIIIQCAAVNATLYKVPKSMNFFELTKEDLELRKPLVQNEKGQTANNNNI